MATQVITPTPAERHKFAMHTMTLRQCGLAVLAAAQLLQALEVPEEFLDDAATLVEDADRLGDRLGLSTDNLADQRRLIALAREILEMAPRLGIVDGELANVGEVL